MQVAPIEKQKVITWTNYGHRELFATIIPLPKFLIALRGKLQQTFNRRVYLFFNCSMSLGEIIFFIISFVGILFYIGYKYDNPYHSGWAASIPMFLCIIFCIKNSFIFYIFGMCYERGIFWHKAFSWLTVLGGVLHWAPLPSKDFADGWVLMGSIFFILVMSLPPIRHYCYEIFIRTHWIGLVGVWVGVFYHKVILGYIAFGLWAFDFLVKQFVIFRHSKNTTDITVHTMTPQVVRIDLAKNNFGYLPGQYVYIMIPEISYFEWHPFGFQTTGGQGRISLYVKVCGNWTNSLLELANKNQGKVNLKGYFCGPYGFPSIDVVSDHYKSFILIGGGIGMAPIISVCKFFLELRTTGRLYSKIMLVWTTRDKGAFDDFINEQYIESIISPEDKQNNLFEPYYHFTGKTSLKTDVETVQMKEVDDSKFIPHRPNLREYIKKLGDHAKSKGESIAGILVCGPEGLITDVQHAARDLSDSEIRFDVHDVLFII